MLYFVDWQDDTWNIVFRTSEKCTREAFSCACDIEQGATHASGLRISLTATAARERMRVGTSRPLAAPAV